MANHFLALIADEGVDALDHVLHRPWVVNRKPRAHDRKEQNQQHEDQQLHGYVVGNRRLGMGRVQMKQRPGSHSPRQRNTYSGVRLTRVAQA